MKKTTVFIVLVSFFLGGLGGVAGVSMALKKDHSVVYRCPEGQVKVLENEGTDQAIVRCYTPGVNYTDYRPLTTRILK